MLIFYTIATWCPFGISNYEYGNYIGCPHCELLGVRVKLRESHVVFVCPAVARQRISLGLSNFRNASVNKGFRSTQSVMRMFLGGDEATKEVLMERGKSLHVILTAWMQMMHMWAQVTYTVRFIIGDWWVRGWLRAVRPRLVTYLPGALSFMLMTGREWLTPVWVRQETLRWRIIGLLLLLLLLLYTSQYFTTWLVYGRHYWTV